MTCLICGSMSVPAGREGSGRSPGRLWRVRRSRPRSFWRSIRSQLLTLVNLQLMADLHHLRAGEGKRVITSLLERFDLVE